MGLLQDIRYARFNSGAVRKLLSLYYKPGSVYRIPFGPTKGMRVQFHDGMNYHAVLGLWERESMKLVASMAGILRRERGRDLLIADVGANLGSYTLLFSRLAEKTGSVVAFEPAPEIARTLRANLALNDLANTSVVEAACSDSEAPITFFIGRHHHQSSLDAAWANEGGETGQALEVAGVTLDGHFAASNQTPDFLKIDIEGGAIFALRGASAVAAARPLIYIESHTPGEDRAISDYVLKNDFAAWRVADRKWVTAPGEVYPSPNGIQGSMFLVPSEAAGRYQELLGPRGQ